MHKHRKTYIHIKYGCFLGLLIGYNDWSQETNWEGNRKLLGKKKLLYPRESTVLDERYFNKYLISQKNYLSLILHFFFLNPAIISS